MIGLMPLLILSAASCVTAARPEEVKELNAFFKQLRAHKDLVSKTILFDDEELSVNDFFELSNANLSQVQDSWPVTEHNVRDASRLFNAAVTCEYSYFALGLAMLLDVRLDECAKTGTKGAEDQMSEQRKCLNSFRARLLEPALGHVAAMLLTLAGLFEYTRNPVSKNHDLWKILLSFYAFLRKDVGAPLDAATEKQMDERLLPIRVTSMQLRSALERVIVAGCQRPRRFAAFKRSTVDAINEGSARTAYTAAGDGAIDELYGEMYRDLTPIASHSFPGKPRFVVSEGDEQFAAISSLLKGWTENLKITWDKNPGESLENVYDTVIKGTADVRTIVRFEKALLQVITEVIVGAVVRELRGISDGGVPDRDKSGACTATVLSKIGKLAEAFRADGQPSYLVNNVVAIGKHAWFVCYLMKEPAAHRAHVDANIGHLAESGRPAGTTGGGPRLDDVLDGLSGKTICAKLHPAFSSVYWDAAAYAHRSGVADYVADFKDVSATCDVRSDAAAMLCAELEDMVQPVEAAADDVAACDEALARGDADAVDGCFARLAAAFKLLLGRTLYVDGYVFVRKCAPWKRLLLALARGLDDGQLLAPGPADGRHSLDARRVRHLERFHHEVLSALDAHRSVHCALKRSAVEARLARDASVAKVLGYDDEGRWHASRPLRSTAAWSAVADGRLDEQCNAYRTYSRGFGDFARAVSDADWLEDECKLYREGAESSVGQVLGGPARYAHDPRDEYDVQAFVVDWMLAVPYVRLLDLLNEMILFKYKPAVAEVVHLKRCLSNVLELPWYVSRTVEFNLLRFYMVVKDFDGTDTGELENMRDVLRGELRFSNVVPDTVPNPKENFAERIDILSGQIESLNSSFDSVRTDVRAAAKRINLTERDLLLFD